MAAIMLSTVSPVMVGAEAASPQPTTPLSASMRTSTLSARLISTPAMKTGFFMGKLTAIGSTCLIFMALLSDQLDLGGAKLDIGETYALLGVDHARSDAKPVFVVELPRRRFEIRHGDRDMAQSGDHQQAPK